MENYGSAIFALAGTLFGGAGLKIVERWLGRAKDKNDMDKQRRDELRTDMATARQEIIALKAEVDKVEAEVVSWRDKYFQQRDARSELQEKYNVLKALYENALLQIREKADETTQAAMDAGIDVATPPVVEFHPSTETDD